MAYSNRRHGQNSHKILDPPAIRHKVGRRKDNHTHNTNQRKRNAELEPLEHFRHFDEEVGEFGLLGGRTPSHVDLEHVGKKCLGDVKGETAEEDAEHQDPFEVFEQGTEEGSVADAVSHDGQCDVSQSVEYDDDREPGQSISLR